jgi:transcriptional regulator with XRE-family HTH domain
MDSEGTRFKQVRKKLGLTLQDMVLMTGYSMSTISGVENGHNQPSRRLRQLLIDKLDINEGWLRTGRGSMFRQSEKVAHAKMVVSQFSSPLEKEISDETQFVRVINKLRVMPAVQRKQWLVAMNRILEDLVKAEKQRKKHEGVNHEQDVNTAFARVAIAVAQDVLAKQKTEKKR